MTATHASTHPVNDTPTDPQGRPPRPRSWLRRVLLATLALLLLTAALVGAAVFWLPGWLKTQMQLKGQDVLGTPVTLQAIELRPWALQAQLQGLQVGPDADPLLRLGALDLQVAAESLWRLAPVVQHLTLQAPEVWLRRNPVGSQEGPFNFSPALQHLRDWQARQPPSPPPPPDSQPARFALHNIRLEGGRLHYTDLPLDQRHEVSELRIGLPFLSNLPADVAVNVQPLLEARVDGSQLKLSGQARPFADGRPAELALRWQALPLAPWASLLKAVLPPEQAVQLDSGSLDSDLTLAFEARPAPQPPRLQIRGELALRELKAASAPMGVQAAWQALKLQGLDLAPLEQQFHLKAMTLDGLDLALRRSPATAGRAASAPTAPAASTPASTSAAASAPAPAASQAPLSARIDALHCSGCRITLRDETVSPAVSLGLEALDLKLQPLSNDLSQPIQLALSTGLSTALAGQKATQGRVSVNGQVVPQPLSLQAALKLADIDLRVAQPYLAPHVNLLLAAARFGSDGRLDLALPPTPTQGTPGGPALHYSGKVELTGLRTQDSVNGADFLGWQKLALDGLDLRLKDGQLDADLGRIGLDGLNARLILHPDGHLNVADIVKRDGQAAPTSITTPQSAASAPGTYAATAPAASAGSSAATGSAAPSPAPKLRWQAITLRDGAVHFSDTFIRPNYSARLTRLQGSVSALRSDNPQPADLKLAGALDDGAPLSIAGRLHPLGPQLYTDLEASARGIALTRMSTYAERWAGYAIEKGTLSVRLKYKIDQGRLEAENQLFLDQLTFGDRVDSPDATKLPVQLAVSLLKNRRGEIDLQLPVAGTLNDPQFSVGGIVWRLLLNLLEKALTAPFSLLFGDGGGEAAQVDFAAGSAELDAAARDRLDGLATKLEDRPALKLEVTGHADPVADGAALAAAQAASQAAANKAAPQPARAASAVAAAPSASAAAVQEANRRVALQTLADRRADQVMAYLSARLPPERILITRSVVDGAPTAPADGASATTSPGSGIRPSVQFQLK